MANDFIKINVTGIGTPNYPRELYNFILNVRNVIDNADYLIGLMNHQIDGSDYSALETNFGIPTGNGDEVYNLVAGTRSALNGTAQSSDALTLIARVG